MEVKEIDDMEIMRLMLALGLGIVLGWVASWLV